TAGRAASPASEAALAATRGPAKPRTMRSGATEPKRGASRFESKSPAIIAMPVAGSVRSNRTGLPAMIGVGQPAAVSAVNALPGATISAVAVGSGLAAGGTGRDAGAPKAGAALATGVLADAAAGVGNASNELAIAIAIRSSSVACGAG